MCDRKCTHADPGEVERLQLEIEKLRLSLTMNDDALIQDGFVRIENRALRSRIDEQNELLREIKSARDWNGSYRALEKRIDAALSASAEPSAPVEGNPSALVDQLQADITARDEELDRVRTVVTTVRRKACLPSEIETLLDSAISCPNR